MMEQLLMLAQTTTLADIGRFFAAFFLILLFFISFLLFTGWISRDE